MTGLLRAEWLKLSRRWVLPVLAVVLLVLTAMSAAFLLILPNVAPDAIAGLPQLSRSDASIIGVQTVLGQTWFPLILAVVMLGSEVTSTAWASALTRESRRHIHVAARLIFFTLAAWGTALLAIAAWEAVAAAYTDGPPAFAWSGWLGVFWKAGITQATWVALGLGVVALVRSTGIAIGIVLAYSFLEGLLTLWAPYGEIAISAASAAMIGETVADVSGGFGLGPIEPMALGQAVLVVLAWACVGVILAWLGLERREA